MCVLPSLQIISYSLVCLRFLPEGNAITVPPWILHRDPRYFFPHPDAFIPERWLSGDGSSEQYLTSRDAFIPFSAGLQNCVGRPLAQMAMRYVLASLMWNFDMEFDTPTYDPSSWERNIEDRFILSKGSLQVKIVQANQRREL
jgi:cytochrome P450